MRQTAFDHAIYTNWAESLSCTVDHLKAPGTDLIPEEALAGSGAIHIRRIGRRAIARLDPALLEIARRALARLPGPAALEPAHLAPVLASRAIRKVEEGRLLYLFPPDFRPFNRPPDTKIRQLALDDAAALAALQEACTPEEVEMGEVSVEDEIGFGCFAGESLVAVATGFRLTGFMDIGVLTHPAYRRRGLGKAVVSALCAWCIAEPAIAQYRCDAANTGSYRIARALGFRNYFEEQSIYLASHGDA